MSGEANSGIWRGLVPPQLLFARRELLGVALEPPDTQPGSWIGAGKALRDPESGAFVLTVDGGDHLGFLSGSTFAGASGPVFIGREAAVPDSRKGDLEVVYADEQRIGHGGGAIPGVAYLLDLAHCNLTPVYRGLWESRSEYEHPRHPLLGYASALFDPAGRRFLMYVEAIDGRLTRRLGLNETVERLLAYQTRLP